METKKKKINGTNEPIYITKGQRGNEKNKLGLIYTHYWHAAVHGVAKSQTQVNNWTELTELTIYKIDNKNLLHGTGNLT